MLRVIMPIEAGLSWRLSHRTDRNAMASTTSHRVITSAATAPAVNSVALDSTLRPDEYTIGHTTWGGICGKKHLGVRGWNGEREWPSPRRKPNQCLQAFSGYPDRTGYDN